MSSIWQVITPKTLRELGDLARGMQYPAVTMAIRRFDRQLETDKELTKRIKQVKNNVVC